MIRVCLAAALLVPSAALAQGDPGPYGKLFGRESARAEKEQTTIDARGSIGAQFGDSLPGSVQDDPLQAGLGSGAAVGLSLGHVSPGYSVNLSGSAIREQYFTEPTPPGTTRYNAGARAGTKIGTRFVPSAEVGYSHSPYYEFFPDFGQGPVGLDNALLPFSPYAIQTLETETVDGTASLRTNLTKKSSIDVSVMRHLVNYAEQPESDFFEKGYRATWSYQLQRNFGVHAGYGQNHVEYDNGNSIGSDYEVIDIGVDFSRAFSLTRRTTFAFATSTSVSKDSHNFNKVFRFNGSLTLAKQFRRTWLARLSAVRDTSFVPGFAEPLFTDTVTASLNGMFTKRLDWMIYTSAGQGAYAFSGTSGFNSVTAASRLSMALGKRVSIFGQYLTYWYEIPPGGLTTVVLPSKMARQTVSVGMSFHVPIYQHVRPSQ